ncbi:MAG: hypothetical protein GC159_11930 [Phycisphaera sp.]|nr:hypothetical protein [Phycisphaera sp.]
MTRTDFLQTAPEGFVWPLCPAADTFVRGLVDEFLADRAFAATLAKRMHDESSTYFFDWVDHVIVPQSRVTSAELAEEYGYVVESVAETPDGHRAMWHPYAQLPRIVLADDIDRVSVAIKVDSIADFQTAHGLSLGVSGTPLSRYRVMYLSNGPESRRGGELGVVERRGYRGYVPDSTDAAGWMIEAIEMWTNRRRRFDDDEEGMHDTLTLAESLAGELDEDIAAWVFAEGERRYWQARNTAGRVQKWRQDGLGLGWANHDHHTFRSSRRHFVMLIRILQAFGFKKRERYYAGAEAGWGAQVMEQPGAGLVIFADVDLRPDEGAIDFTVEPLPTLDKPGTVGMWCGLHGESMLRAGMHHLEAQFDFDHLRDALKKYDVETMKPFSDFAHLRQAFTVGERWKVDPKRLDAMRDRGAITAEAYAKFAAEGAIGSHLENLQRKQGFKGFNQHSVSQIIREVNPEKQALEH